MKDFLRKLRDLYDSNIWVKQAWDQTMHVLIGIAVVGLLCLAVGGARLAVVLTGVLWLCREALQWPPGKWWDPVVDVAFQALGLWLAYLIYS